MILLDYSHVAIASILAFISELKKESGVTNLIRHIILSSIQFHKKKHYKCGELVICCDSRSYWRRDFFPYYKGTRKSTREKSDIPWSVIFDTMNMVIEELRENFPYKIITVDGAEADDVIAVLAEWSQDNDLIKIGLFNSAQPVMIVSSDYDFKQLQKFPNVSQWSPKTKALVVAEQNYMTTGHLRHISSACDDGIPNVLNDDTVLVTEGVRQKPMRAVRLSEFVALGIAACKTDQERLNWVRNQTLIDFCYIPEHIKSAIIDTYITSVPTGNTRKIFNYLVKNNCRLLLDSVEGF